MWRAAVAVIATAAILLCAGCKEKMVFNIADTPIPDLSGGVTPRSTVAQARNDGTLEDSITFPGAKPAALDDYANWLVKNGWTKQSESGEVTSARVILVKERKRVTLTFSARDGLTIIGNRPK